ncbi:hypothetical protein ACEPAH_1042 [Sanghuangporus vaninii]
MGPPSSAAGISIPTQDATMVNAPGVDTAADDSGWPPASGRSPGHGDSAPPRRSSRSRSPGARNGRDDRDRENRRENTNPGNNLHVSGLSNDVDNDALEAVFIKVGRVQKVSIMYDPHSKESRGFAFVTMETPEEADAAINALNATKQFGKVISVEKARRARARTPTPGRYYGPPKRRGDNERPYDPRPYDSRYSRDYRDDRRGGRYDEYRGGGRYDDRGDRYHGRGDRDRDRSGSDRKYDDRRY